MINNIFPLAIQAAVISAIAQSPVVTTFESATLWVDDEIRLFALGY